MRARPYLHRWPASGAIPAPASIITALRGRIPQARTGPPCAKAHAALGRLAAVLAIAFAACPLIAAEPPPPPAAVDDPRPLRAEAQGLLAALAALPDRRERRLIIGQNLGTADGAAHGYRVHVEEPAAGPGGRRPLLVGVDYGWDRIEAGAIAAANRVLVEHWRRGGLVTVCMHPGNPCRADGTVREDDDVDLAAVIRPGTDANRRWMAMLATVADGLDELRRARVVVLWRPLHEMNAGWFWWGSGGDGPEQRAAFLALWRHLHRYLTVERGLDNLLWVYAPNAVLDEHIRPVASRYPGADLVDLVGYDLYTATDALDAQTWDRGRSYRDLIALGKPFAVTELGPIPSARGAFASHRAITSLLAACPRVCIAAYWHDWEEPGPLGPTRAAMAIASQPEAAAMMADDLVRTLDHGRPTVEP